MFFCRIVIFDTKTVVLSIFFGEGVVLELLILGVLEDGLFFGRERCVLKYERPDIEITIIEDVETDELVVVSSYEEEERPWLLNDEGESEYL